MSLRRVDAVTLTGAGEDQLMADRFASQTKSSPEMSYGECGAFSRSCFATPLATMA